MKTISLILTITFIFSLNAQAVTFTQNILEIHEVSILEEGLNPIFLK